MTVVTTQSTFDMHTYTCWQHLKQLLLPAMPAKLLIVLACRLLAYSCVTLLPRRQPQLQYNRIIFTGAGGGALLLRLKFFFYISQISISLQL